MPSFNTFQSVFFLCFGHISGVFTAPVPRWNGNHHWSSSGSSVTTSASPAASTTTSWDISVYISFASNMQRSNTLSKTVLPSP
ncbi:hypothetical protein F5051DRAFT_163847 [Lentinula edodes]|nr:hypothetical protein F5051DRAFT_163847 [Lentinula edodes]